MRRGWAASLDINAPVPLARCAAANRSTRREGWILKFGHPRNRRSHFCAVFKRKHALDIQVSAHICQLKLDAPLGVSLFFNELGISLGYGNMADAVLLIRYALSAPLATTTKEPDRWR
jgi:hypothetical protein